MLISQCPAFPRPLLAAPMLALALTLAGCGAPSSPSQTAQGRLDARAVLPADTFTPGGPVGAAMDTVINGRRLPLSGAPVQGFSALILSGPDQVLALQDNGFGALANSGDVPLRWFRLGIDWAGGTVEVLQTVTLRDPGRLVPHALAGLDSARGLGGGDFDPEAFVAMPDGTFWIAEEFGPSLLHVSADGRLLDKPVFLSVPRSMRALARGSPYLRSPDHPDVRFLRREANRVDVANLPRSGCEGLAPGAGGQRLYVLVEKALVDDPAPQRRLLLEFDPRRRAFTGQAWYYRTAHPDHAVTELTAIGGQEFLVIERDGLEGRRAKFKRVFRVHLGVVDGDGYLVATPVCDLLDLDDPQGLTRGLEGGWGYGRRYAFPYITPEAVAVADDSTLVLVNDNNYPFSAGRRAGVPDDNEFIRVRLRRPLHAAGPE